MPLPRRASLDPGFVIVTMLLVLAPFDLSGRSVSTAGSAGMAIDAAQMFQNPLQLDAARALDRGDYARLDADLSAGLDLNASGEGGSTLLMYATGRRDKNAMRELLRRGANPNQRSDSGLSAVMLGAGGDDPEILRILLDGRADPNLRSDRNEPVTFTAARQERWENLDLLLRYGGDINATDRAGYTLMIMLVMLDRFEPVAKLLEKGADPTKATFNKKTLADYVQSSRVSPSSPEGQWRDKVIELLNARGIAYPPKP